MLDFVADDGGVSFADGALEIEVGPELGLEIASYAVEVLHPSGEIALQEPGLVVMEAPVATGILPRTIPGDDVATVTITGFRFLDLEGRVPAVQIGDHVWLADELASCTQLAVPGNYTCKTLFLDVDGSLLQPGAYEVTVRNPIPSECAATVGALLTISAPGDGT